jgi:hypothetical protein
MAIVRLGAYKPRSLCSQSLSYLPLSLSLSLSLSLPPSLCATEDRRRPAGRRDGVVAEVGGRAGEARVDRRHRPAASQERW